MRLTSVVFTTVYLSTIHNIVPHPLLDVLGKDALAYCLVNDTLSLLMRKTETNSFTLCKKLEGH